MLRGEKQVDLARLRMELRRIDAEIAAVRRESRRYREMRFGLDIKEIQLTALQDQRDACSRRIAELRQQLQIRRTPHVHPLAWLLLPVALWAHMQKAVAARLAERAPGVAALPAAIPHGEAVPVVRREALAASAGN